MALTPPQLPLFPNNQVQPIFSTYLSRPDDLVRRYGFRVSASPFPKAASLFEMVARTMQDP
jgi:hypothetical protein